MSFVEWYTPILINVFLQSLSQFFILLVFALPLWISMIERKKFRYFFIIIGVALAFIQCVTTERLIFCLFLIFINPTLTAFIMRLRLLEKIKTDEFLVYAENITKLLSLKHISIWSTIIAFLLFGNMYVIGALIFSYELPLVFVYIFLCAYILKILIQILITHINHCKKTRPDWELPLVLEGIPTEYTCITDENYFYKIWDMLFRIFFILVIMWVFYLEITSMSFVPTNRFRSLLEIVVVVVRTITSVIFNFAPLIYAFMEILQYFTRRKLNTLFYFQLFPVQFIINCLNTLYKLYVTNNLIVCFSIITCISYTLSFVILLSLLNTNIVYPCLILFLVAVWPARFFFNYTISFYKLFFKITEHKKYFKFEDYHACNFIIRKGKRLILKKIEDLEKIEFYNELLQIFNFMWFLIFIPFTIYFWDIYWRNFLFF